MLTQDGTLASQMTPDRVQSRLGRLDFRDGAPTAETAETLFDHLTFSRGVDAVLNAFQLASIRAIRQGFLEAGVQDNEVLIFSELMDSKSTFLTANADTVYYIAFIDLTAGPMVFVAPPQSLGVVDDMWFRWVTDFGLPGPDRGEGGRYLFLPPGYDGPLPDGGFQNVCRSRTNRVCMLGRSFMVDNDPTPVVATIKDTMRIYPYVAGAAGTSVATLLEGEVPMAANTPAPALVYHEGSGLEINTVPPNDERFFDVVNEAIQDEPAEAGDPEITGQLEVIGIVRGKPFAPDERTRGLLAEAVAVGNATARSLVFHPRGEEGFSHYNDGAWSNSLFVGGYEFMTPPPAVTPEGIRPYPATGARKLNARTNFYYYATGDSPAMCMRLTGIGSQYLWAMTDGDGTYLDGAEHYTVTLPDDIPAARFWSLTAYDNQTRSMLQTDQRFPRAGSQSFPTPAAQAGDDGTTTIHFSPERPDDVAAGNWIQTVPGKGWNVILRLYSPLPSFFDQSWRPGEFMRVST
jgi:hypothetical protein